MIQDQVQASFGIHYREQPVDAVIIDRGWRPDLSLELVETLINQVHQAGVKLIYSLDDDFFRLPDHNSFRFNLPAIKLLLQAADGVLVTTQQLAESYKKYNPNIFVVPQALDERLIIPKFPVATSPGHQSWRLVIGYMGTLTHDDDLNMVLPALEQVYQNHVGEVEFQILGVVAKESTLQKWQHLPLRILSPLPWEDEYPMFMLWYTSQIQWDIAIAPLQNTDFNNAKSDTKFLDYCAIGAAGIYSNTPVYQSSVVNNETGLLVDNNFDDWVKALEVLISDNTYRLRLAQNAHKYLYENRVLGQCVRNWIDALNHLLA